MKIGYNELNRYNLFLIYENEITSNNGILNYPVLRGSL